MRTTSNPRYAGIGELATEQKRIPGDRLHDLLINMFPESARERILTGYEGLRRGTVLEEIV